MRNIFPARRAAAVCMLATALVAGCAESDPEALLASGKEYLTKKDQKAAVIQLKNALQANPKLAEARFLLGKTLLDIGDAEGAEKELRKALDLKYPSERVVPPLARSLVLLGQYKTVTDEFSNSKLSSPEANAELQSAIGTAHLNLGNREAAQKAFGAALLANPDHAPARLGLAQIAARSRDYGKALAIVEDVLKSRPRLAEAWHLKGDILRAQDHRGPAVEAYRKALENQADALPTHYELIVLLVEQHDLGSAAKQLEAMKRVASGHPQTFYVQALIAYRQQNLAAARAAIQQHLKHLPESIPGLALSGRIEFGLNSYTLAEEQLIRVLQRAPGHSSSRLVLAMTYLGSGNAEKALNVLRPVLTKNTKDASLLAVAGQTYMLTGDYVQASDYFARAAAADPNDSSKRAALGLSLLARGEIQRGLRELEGAAAESSDTRADLALIAVHMRRRDHDSALRAIARLERKQPQSAAPHNFRGSVLFARNDWAGARRSFERALGLDRFYFAAVANIARLDLAENKSEAARQRLEAFIAQHPQHREALLTLAELRSKTGAPPQEVTGLLTKAISAHPNDTELRIALVGYYISTKDAKKAVIAAQDALAVLPNDTEVLMAAGRAYLAAGDANQALSTYRKLVSLQPKSPQPHLRIAEVHALAKDLESAVASLQKALSIQPDLLEAQHRLAAVHVTSGRPEQALEVARQIQKQRPKETRGFILEGDIHAANKRWAEAAAAYQRGLKHEASAELAIKLYEVLRKGGNRASAERFSADWLTEHPLDGAVRLHLAQTAMLRQDYSTAVQHYRKLVEQQPKNALTWNNLAWTSAQLKDPKAIEYAEQAYQLAPQQPAVMDTLGMLLIERGETARGMELLRKAAAVPAASPEIRLNLAKAFIGVGQKDAARKELAELAKLGQKFSRHAEVKQLSQGL